MSTSVEWRIIRELFETRKGGLIPKHQGLEYGRVIETVITRELNILIRKLSDRDLRFSRGYIVRDYGGSESGEVIFDAKPQEIDIYSTLVESEDPRFDIVCYEGFVAWNHYNGLPIALVPRSHVRGVIEVKRTISPTRFTNSEKGYNLQLRDHRNHLSELDIDVPRVVIGLLHYGTMDQNNNKALADFVAGIGNANHAPDAKKMTNEGMMEKVVEILLEGEPRSGFEGDSNLQSIAEKIVSEE